VETGGLMDGIPTSNEILNEHFRRMNAALLEYLTKGVKKMDYEKLLEELKHWLWVEAEPTILMDCTEGSDEDEAYCLAMQRARDKVVALEKKYED
jgi:hypothetical protein